MTPVKVNIICDNRIIGAVINIDHITMIKEIKCGGSDKLYEISFTNSKILTVDEKNGKKILSQMGCLAVNG